MAGYVITAVAVIVVIIVAVLVVIVAYCVYKRSCVCKKNTERNIEEAVPTPDTSQMASSSSSSRRSSIEADKQQKHMNENFKELHDKVDHIGRKVDRVNDKVDYNTEITDQCNTSVTTISKLCYIASSVAVISYILYHNSGELYQLTKTPNQCTVILQTIMTSSNIVKF